MLMICGIWAGLFHFLLDNATMGAVFGVGHLVTIAIGGAYPMMVEAVKEYSGKKKKSK